MLPAWFPVLHPLQPLLEGKNKVLPAECPSGPDTGLATHLYEVGVKIPMYIKGKLSLRHEKLATALQLLNGRIQI